MNVVGRVVLNSPARVAAQRRVVIPTMQRLGGSLEGCRVLEIGCGRGVGTELLLEMLGAAAVDAIDVDPVMVRLATRRLGSRANVRVGDMVHTGGEDASYDAVVDMGAIHLEPRWREALSETRRVLRPTGRFYFEEIVHPTRQVLSVVATGKRLERAFTQEALLGGLHTVGLDRIDYEDDIPSARTGMVGDVIGVARASHA